MNRTASTSAACLAVCMAIGSIASSAAQGPAAGASPGAAPASPGQSLAPDTITTCPVSVEEASVIAGVAMTPNPMYQTTDGSLYVEHVARMPGGDPETTIHTCAYLSATGMPPDRKLFIQFSVGDSASWLWEVNGPTIADTGTYQAIVDADPATADIYRATNHFDADGGAYPQPMWEADRYLHSDRLFAHIIVDAAGEKVTAEQVELMASTIGLALQEAIP